MNRSSSRLGNHSARRRRVVALAASSWQAQGAIPRSAFKTEPAVNEPVVSPNVLTVPAAVFLPVAPPVPRREPIDTPPPIAPFLLKEGSLTWVVAGEAALAGEAPPDKALPLAGHLARAIRTPAQRSQDQLIDVLNSRSTAVRMRATWETRVLALHPDVIVLFFGHGDAEAGMRGFARFEDALSEMLADAGRLHIPVIVNTPPCLPETDERRLADRQIYLEALRAIAKTYDGLLVDHWDHWETTAIDFGGTEVWYDSTGQLPGELGHRQMVRLFSRTLGLTQLAVTV